MPNNLQLTKSRQVQNGRKADRDAGLCQSWEYMTG